MRKAFTLVELLVTIILFSLLLIIALYSFRFASIDIKSVNNTNPEKAIFYHMLRNTISSIYPYVLVDKKDKDKKKSIYYFFDGKKTECYFVSSRGMFYDRTVLAHIYYANNELWYTESELFNKNVNYLQLKENSSIKKVLLLKNITNFKLSYLLTDNFISVCEKNIPKIISIDFKENKEIKRYYFSVVTDNTQRRITVIQNREIL